MPIALVNTEDRKRVIFSGDSAIDAKKSDVDKYQDTLDIDHLVFHADDQPTYWTIKPLSTKDVRQARRKASQDAGTALVAGMELFCECFLRGVVKIENLAQRIDGPYKRGIPQGLADQIPLTVQQEIGQHIYQLSVPQADPVKEVEDEHPDGDHLAPDPEDDLKK